MTPAHDIRLLITDVDGTLVPHSKVLSPAAIAAAGELRAAGIGMALTSARPPFGMRMLIEPLNITLPLAGFNGGLIVDRDLTELECHPIAPDVAMRAIQLLSDGGVDVWIYTDAAWFVSRHDGPHVAREAWILQRDPKPAPPSVAGNRDRVFKIVGVSDDHAKMATLEGSTQSRLGDTASVSRSAPHYLDVTDTHANKGQAARSLSARLGLPPAQIAAIGDMPNDLWMFRECGFSIAMGNASDLVKASADAVTDSNESDGFAKAVRRHLLPQTPIASQARRAP